MTPQLHDLMHRAVADAEPDVADLTDRARRRGLAIRRRRQALGLVGVAAGAALVAGTLQVLPSLEAAPRGDTATAPASPSPTEVLEPVPLSGRATAAALLTAVEEVAAPGEASDFAGQGVPTSLRESYAQLAWRPAGDTGVSPIGVNVQPGFAETDIYECRAWQSACRLAQRADGSTLMTYEERAAGGYVRRVADVLRPDGVRVVASSSNGLDLPGGDYDVTRPQPALSRPQLVAAVSMDYWGETLPGRFQRDGEALQPYRDLDAERAAPSPETDADD